MNEKPTVSHLRPPQLPVSAVSAARFSSDGAKNPLRKAKKKAIAKKELLSEKQVESLLQRVLENKPVRRSFAGWGRIHIDRQLPFVCVHRRLSGQADGATHRLLLSAASYLMASGSRGYYASMADLLGQLEEVMVERFGAFLVVEIWAGGRVAKRDPEAPPRPAFKIYADREDAFSSTVQTLCQRLSGIKTSKQGAEVEIVQSSRVAPPGMKPLLKSSDKKDRGCFVIGIEVSPVYINPKTGDPYPLLLRSLKRQFSQALDQAFYDFSLEHTTHQPKHYYALGRRAMVHAVWDIDRQLAAVSNSFDLLLQVTPINSDRSWAEFKRRRFEKEPVFLYRPRSVDPGQMKRALYDMHIDRVEDPTLMHLFLDKQMELDRQLTMLHDLGTKQFLFESLQLHGDVPLSLVAEAEKILETTPSRERRKKKVSMLTPAEFAERARGEIAWYATKNPEFKASAQVSADGYSGLLVSRGRLLIGKNTSIPANRADALLQHEVGTHLLTYFNGRAQPFKMLCSGLPGYDELQEGLAVLSEYLVGGLGTSRLRVLAARVVAARAMIDGASFVEVFRLLDRTHEFAQRVAYTITTRVFRGGGLVKDAIYLRGLFEILKYIADDGDFNQLFIGKIAAKHIGVVEELLLRNILKPPPVYPRYLENESVQERLQKLRSGLRVLDLINK